MEIVGKEKGEELAGHSGSLWLRWSESCRTVEDTRTPGDVAARESRKTVNKAENHGLNKHSQEIREVFRDNGKVEVKGVMQ